MRDVFRTPASGDDVPRLDPMGDAHLLRTTPVLR